MTEIRKIRNLLVESLLFFFLFSSCDVVIEKQPVKPANLKATKGEFANKIILTWDSVENVSFYQVFRLNKETKELSWLGTSKNCFYVDSDFLSTEKQYYKIRACGENNIFSLVGDSVIGYTSLYSGIIIPQNFKATKGIYFDKVTLTWTKTPFGNSYEIYKQEEQTRDFELLAITTDTLFEDKNIPKGYSKKYYRIRARNKDGDFSGYSSVDYGFTQGDVYEMVGVFGKRSFGEGTLVSPANLEIDSYDNVFISDYDNYRVQKFDKTGNFLDGMYLGANPGSIIALSDRLIFVDYQCVIIEIDYNKNQICKWNGDYSLGRWFHPVNQIAIDDEKNIYITDPDSYRIQKYDLNGNYIKEWHLNACTGISFYKNMILVSEGKSVMFYSKNGEYIKQWDLDVFVNQIKVSGDDIYLLTPHYVIKTTEDRNVDVKIGQNVVVKPGGIAVDSNNRLYISDLSSSLIYIFKEK